MSLNKKGIVFSFILSFAFSLFAQDVKGLLKEKLNDGNWIMSWYAKVLESQNRETVIKYFPNIEKNNSYDEAFETYSYWYDLHNFNLEKIEINQSRVNKGQESLRIGDIQEILLVDCIYLKGFFKIRGKEDIYNYDYDDFSRLDWSLLRKADEFTLIFSFDGDYLNIYLNKVAKNTLFATFCRFDDATLAEFEQLIYKNIPPNPSSITWPRHADGSCDYDDYRIITVQQDSRYRTIDNLRLRSAEETTSDILSTLEKGTIVTVLSLGKEDTIDGIQSNWVKVQLEDGTKGWCFGGYLLPAPIETTSGDKSNQAEEPNENTNSTTNTFAGLSATTLIVGGGVVILLLSAGVFLFLKRKK